MRPLQLVLASLATVVALAMPAKADPLPLVMDAAADRLQLVAIVGGLPSHPAPARVHRGSWRFDGVFGTCTRSALVRFQRSHGLKADGVAGPRTLAALAAGRRRSLHLGSRGRDVLALQHALDDSGCWAGTPQLAAHQATLRTKVATSLHARLAGSRHHRALALAALPTRPRPLGQRSARVASVSDRVGAELRVVPQRLPAVVKPLLRPVVPAPVRPAVTPAAVAGPAVEAELHSWFPARDASFAGAEVLPAVHGAAWVDGDWGMGVDVTSLGSQPAGVVYDAVVQRRAADGRVQAFAGYQGLGLGMVHMATAGAAVKQQLGTSPVQLRARAQAASNFKDAVVADSQAGVGVTAGGANFEVGARAMWLQGGPDASMAQAHHFEGPYANLEVAF